MATLDFGYGYGSGIYVITGSGTLTYSTSTTNTGVTLTVTKIKIENTSGASATFTYSVSFGGTTLASGSVTLANGASTTKTISGSKTVTRGHTASTATLKVTGSGGGGTASASASISVPARSSYAVTYDANGGSGAPSSQTKWYDETLALSSGKPSRSGYAFWHWNTSTSDTGTTYSPGASYASNAALALHAIWNPIVTYDANGGSGAPSAQTKTYGQALTLSSVVPTRAGHTFLGWATSSSATSASYQPGASYTSNYSATLYAVWRKNPVAPTISGMSVVRSDSSGNPDDTGTYCKVTATWSVDRTGAGMGSNTGVVTGQIAAQGGTTRTITWQSGTSGTSGTAVALVSGCDIDTQYLVSVTVTNTSMGTGQSSYLSTTRSDILTRAFFTLDFADGGRGIGIGSAAPSEGVEIGLATQVDDDLTVLGTLTVGGSAVVTTRVKGNAESSYRTGDVNLTPANIGAAASSHTHGAGDITSGTLLPAHGGTGQTSLQAARNAMGLGNTTGVLQRPNGGTGVANRQSSSVSLSNCTCTSNAMWHNGVVATVALQGIKPTAALSSGSSVVIGTITSTAYRPLEDVYIMAVSGSTTLIGKVYVRITAGGEVRLYNYSGSTIAKGSSAGGVTVTYCI